MHPEKAIRLNLHAVSLKPVLSVDVKSNVSVSESPDEAARSRHQRGRMWAVTFYPNFDDYNILCSLLHTTGRQV